MTVSIEDLVRAIAREEISAALGRGDDGFYSTIPGSWPPGCPSRRAARERIRAVVGHAHEGKVWRVSVEAYRAYYRRKPEPVSANVQRTDEELAELALAGLRPTRRTR